MDPQQELFSYLLVALKEKYPDIGIYDSFLPPEGTPYPFIYLADSHQTDDKNKTTAFGNVFQTIHVWHNSPRQRNLQNMDQRILADTTTKQPLIHGVLELEFKFN